MSGDSGLLHSTVSRLPVLIWLKCEQMCACRLSISASSDELSFHLVETCCLKTICGYISKSLRQHS